MTDAKIREIAKDVFRHFTRGAVEFFYLLSLSREKIDGMIDFEGKEHIDEALSLGKGCIIVTAHYGNWELLARKLVILGYKVNVIARDSDDAGITGVTQRIRESGGYKVFDRDQPIIGAFRALKKNEILGILPDQNDYRRHIRPILRQARENRRRPGRVVAQERRADCAGICPENRGRQIPGGRLSQFALRAQRR